MSQIFSLSSKDWIKGLVVAVLAAIFTWLAQILSVPGFDFASLSYVEVVRIALVAATAYIAKNFVTDDKGKLLGMDL